MHECPSCDRVFETLRGLGVHHVSAHDERLPKGHCRHCGVPLTSEDATKYCSQACFHEGHSFAGENHPNYQGKIEITDCELCGATFKYYPSEKKGLFCPDCVESEQWRDPPDPPTGSENALWNGGKVELTCPVCGEAFERYPSNVTDGTNLCSNECRSTWLSEAFTGDGHPNWKGGGNEPYGKGWARIRQQALERDNYRCIICGKTRVELGRNPDVHHIVPVRAFIEAEDHEKADAHTLDNVASLCIDCHRKADFGKLSVTVLRDAIDSDA